MYKSQKQIEEEFDKEYPQNIELPKRWSEDIKSHISQIRQNDLIALKELAEKRKEHKKYKAMVENGDLSFLNYTPTGIYNKAITDFIHHLSSLNQ